MPFNFIAIVVHEMEIVVVYIMEFNLIKTVTFKFLTVTVHFFVCAFNTTRRNIETDGSSKRKRPYDTWNNFCRAIGRRHHITNKQVI